MKYPQSVPMPRDVEDWLEGELEARGIDAVVYTRYILSLMQQDTLDFELNDIWSDCPTAKTMWNRHERKQLDEWRLWDQEALKRLAVVRCLMTATGQKYEIESLVEELCAKLKDIQNSAQNQEPSFLQPYEIPTDFNKMFPPLQGKFEDRGIVGEESCTTSAWTRGILRASLDTSNTALPYNDAVIKAQEFPMMYQGPRGMFEDYIDMLTEKAQLQQDSSFFSNHISDHCFGPMKRIDSPWNPINAADKLDSFKPNHQAFFYDNNKLFSSTDYVMAQKKQSATVTPPVSFATWSLGGPANTLPNHKPEASCFKEVARKSILDGKSPDNGELPGSLLEEDSIVEEEDLLTSERTHFRPIRVEYSVFRDTPYLDGSTFALSTELKPLQFQRSESGVLFLETGKYMEYKTEENNEPGEFVLVPKFKVRQSNEKFCQTEEADVIAELSNQQVAQTISSESSESDPDEFYFPGDDVLALHLNGVDEKPAEDEVAQIVSGRLDVRWRALSKPTTIVDEHDMEPNWESNNEALVNQLVDEEPPSTTTWSTCTITQPDDVSMEGVIAENDAPLAPTTVPCWPQLTDSIWNSKLQNCDTCRGPSTSDDNSQQLMAEKQWQGIWGQPICDGCKIEAGTDGKIETQQQQKDVTDSFWKWPDLGNALTTYLEESRLRAFELLNIWSPVNISNSFDAAKKTNECDLRELWGSSTPEADAKMTECRAIWSPLHQQSTAPTQRPRTYSMLREELSEDGDQLLSDLSCLHMKQLNAGDSHDYDFATPTPSTICQPGPFVNIFGTWNLVIDDKDLGLLELPYNSETAQKERKRRHSSSQKTCELYRKGECRRPHCRFMHGADDASPSPLITAFTPNIFRSGHELQRAFTL